MKYTVAWAYDDDNGSHNTCQLLCIKLIFLSSWNERSKTWIHKNTFHNRIYWEYEDIFSKNSVRLQRDGALLIWKNHIVRAKKYCFFIYLFVFPEWINGERHHGCQRKWWDSSYFSTIFLPFSILVHILRILGRELGCYEVSTFLEILFARLSLYKTLGYEPCFVSELLHPGKPLWIPLHTAKSEFVEANRWCWALQAISQSHLWASCVYGQQWH